MVVGHSELMGGADEAQEGGGASGGSSDIGPSTSIPVDSGGSRWPRQETLALIKIRSDMDPIFKDASLKAPLWEQVSRKMGELGFQRSAKKCREKFENVYKYHKRTKDGRASKPEGKTYRFFDQLEALENNPILNIPHLGNTNSQLPSSAAAAALPTSPTPVTVLPPPPRFQPEAYATSHHHHHHNYTQQQERQPSSHLQALMLSDSTTMSSSSSSSSEEKEVGGHGRRNGRSRRRRKKKWKDYLEMMMRQVFEKQEERQKRLLENLEQREMDRIAEEEAWRQQEMARINREHDLLVRERSMAAAKDAAMIAFLEKITNESHQSHHQQQPAVDLEPLADGGFISRKEEENGSGGGGGGRDSSASSSRWPKAEVEALINLRTSLDLKYHDGAPKGPLWEEISAAMAKMGYKRSSKRCKEKWENINKYYKKVKETNKKRPDDSKTCPYFHKLEALHQRKMAARNNNVSTSAIYMASTCSTSAATNV